MVYVEWIISIAVVSLLAVLLGCTICGCRKVPKNELMGLAGMVKITNPDESMNHNYLHDNERAGNATTDIAGHFAETADANRRTTSTANRSLPDIPFDPERARLDSADILWENNEPNGDTCSELYATVEENKNRPLPASMQMQSTSRISKLPTASDDGKSSEYSSLSQADDGFASYAQVKAEHPYDRLKKSEHPYAQVGKHVEQNGQAETSSRSRQTAQAGSSALNPVPPPRSRKSNSFNSSTVSSPNSDFADSDIHAATAIAGRIAANQELPYMTPPIPTPAMVSEPQTHFSGDSQDSSKGYTSISVREPLANIKAQTQQKTRTRQLADSHYATVSDDSEEMYAAIDDAQPVYTSGSETYAQIQPLPVETSSIVQAEAASDGSSAPPQPPSVDSLKHVAQAHSRQASSSSAASSVANLGSPKPEKRQANSPLPPPPAVGHDLYSTVDKKSSREPPTEKNLEEMYAKVTKKNARSNAGSRNELVIVVGEEVNEIEPATIGDNISADSLDMSSSRESIEIRLQKDGDSQSVNSSYMDIPSDFSGRTDRSESTHPYQQLSTPSTLQPSNESSDSFLSLPYTDPGYEAVKKPPLSDSDPNYEEVSRAPLSDSDPNYEVVRRAPLSDSDPNYEVVRRSPLSDSDPNYEVVRRAPLSDSDPNYEVVRRAPLSDSDPNYEELHLKVAGADRDYSRYLSVTSDKDSVEPGYASIGRRSLNDPSYEHVPFPSEHSGYANISKNRNHDEEGYANEPPYQRLQEDGDITPSYNNSVANQEFTETQNEEVDLKRYKFT